MGSQSLDPSLDQVMTRQAPRTGLPSPKNPRGLAAAPSQRKHQQIKGLKSHKVLQETCLRQVRASPIQRTMTGNRSSRGSDRGCQPKCCLQKEQKDLSA